MTDSQGKTLYVQMPVKAYEKLLADAEDRDAEAAYLKGKQSLGKLVPFDKAFEEIEKSWAGRK